MPNVPRKKKKAPARKKATKKAKGTDTRPHPCARTRKRIRGSASARDSKSGASHRKSAPPTPPPAPSIEEQNRIIWQDKWWYIPPDKQVQFLAFIANGERHAHALKKVGIEWRQVSAYMVHDPEFKEAYELAIRTREDFMAIVRAEEADHRAIEGWEEPVFHKDQEVGRVRRFSDRLMELRLKGHDPKKYADRHEHHHTNLTGGPERPQTISDWERQCQEAKEANRITENTKNEGDTHENTDRS